MLQIIDTAPIEGCPCLFVMLAAAAGIEVAVMIAADDYDVLKAWRRRGVRLAEEGFQPVDLLLNLRHGAIICEVSRVDQEVAGRYLGGWDFAVGV